jgi:predicted secreted protein
MSLALSIAVYLVIWWTMLFAVLPFGVKSQQEAKDIVPGSEPGAPTVPWLGRKLIANTIVSAVVWGVADYLYVTYYVQH